MSKWVLLGGAIISEVTATLCLKAALDHPALYSVVTLGYLASFVFLGLVLRRGVPLGVAYGIWAATGVALTAAMSAVIFGEAVTAVTGAGLALIVVGVFAVQVGSRAEARPGGGP